MALKFFTFEGGEGSGKSTQTNLLFESFQRAKFDVILTREPGGTESAEFIRNLLLRQKLNLYPITQLLLHNACRYEHVKGKILPALRENKKVICDRFVDSTLAYQGYGLKLGRKYPTLLHNMFMEGVAPDLTFILDVDPEKGLSRAKAHGDFDNYEKMDLEFHRRVRQGFLEIAEMAKNRCIVINSNQSVSSIHNQIIKIINDAGGLNLQEAPNIHESKLFLNSCK